MWLVAYFLGFSVAMQRLYPPYKKIIIEIVTKELTPKTLAVSALSFYFSNLLKNITKTSLQISINVLI